MKKKIIVGLCALLLMALIGATIPSAFAANDQIYFTAVNETVLALNDSTMPFFSGGSFYVPYTIFESTVTGENVGLFTSYSRAKGAVLIYNMSGSLLFDLNENNSVYNGTLYSESAIIRNSTVFIPINMVCRFFELDWAWLFSSQGSVIRLKSPAASLSDQEFITAANYTLNERLRAYLQNQTPYPTGGPTVSPSPTPSTPVTDGAQVRIAHLMGEESNEFPKLLDTLEESDAYALFLISPEHLPLRDDDVRLLLARGHRIGLYLDAPTVVGQQFQLERGRKLLSAIAHAHTSICMSTGLTEEELQALGPSVLLWESTVDLSAEDGRTTSVQVREISDTVVDDGDYFILLNDSPQAALVLERTLTPLALKGCHFPAVTEFSLIG